MVLKSPNGEWPINLFLRQDTLSALHYAKHSQNFSIKTQRIATWVVLKPGTEEADACRVFQLMDLFLSCEF